ncbi:hypothetical protein EYZ11_006213 [Aspergillus tanneri]|uniref:RecA family profile 1 domain-containing protein n=1 Tax=Aspergillus tanneri TaxID=1220188 RepID=A0A4S3JIB4_9EURO|nr:uncharacterized protein ATNIH1004_000758 [Aspergillus tanneri]KAA8651860.1 hypothetical protein ATNIH1004_000758 [Aspergillus tanneri]THC94307.1 hypothetical protein EYZ11_006213 [Aspergillus tanneri]
MDLLSVLPDFSTKSYSHILSPLERANINTVDLITLDPLEIAKRAHVPPADVRRLASRVVKALHHDVGFEDTAEPSSSVDIDTPVTPGPSTRLDLSQWSAISTLDPTLDALLAGGGIPTGYVTEVTGESGSGKTQFLLTLLLAVQLRPPRGLAKTAIYISTEAPLSTPRLSQLLDFHPYLSTLPHDEAPSLQNILSINAMDLEAQDHILNYQLPVAVSRYNVGLVIVDSITSNYRAEHTSTSVLGLSTRSWELAKLGQMLRNLAVKEDIAIVVANQVSDRFDGPEGLSLPSSRVYAGNVTPAVTSSPSTQQQQYLQPPRSSNRDSTIASPLAGDRPPESRNVELSQHNIVFPSSPPTFQSSPYTADDDQQQQQQQQQQAFDGSYLVGNPVRNEIFSLLHQQRFFTGWGDSPSSLTASPYPGFQKQAHKTPALGLVWLTQIACRIALKKEVQPMLLDPSLEENPLVSLPSHLSANETRESTPQNNWDPGSTTSLPTNTTAQDEPGPSPLTDPAGGRDFTSTPLHKTTTVTVTAGSQIPPPPPTELPLRRTMKLVLAPWTAGSVTEHGSIQDEAAFIIWKGGLKGCED